MNKELITVQSKLRAPKGQFNRFGKYRYRSAEDILEAVKPLLKEVGAQLTLSDSIEQVGNRIYVKAVATFESESGVAQVSAFAREPDEKKGMDDSQITGTASSYARKYALNGLFCIDDTKDADTDEYHQQTAKQEKQDRPIPVTGGGVNETSPINGTQRKIIESLCQNAGQNPAELFAKYGWPNISQGVYADGLRQLKEFLAKDDKDASQRANN